MLGYQPTYGIQILCSFLLGEVLDALHSGILNSHCLNISSLQALFYTIVKYIAIINHSLLFLQATSLT